MPRSRAQTRRGANDTETDRIHSKSPDTKPLAHEKDIKVNLGQTTGLIDGAISGQSIAVVGERSRAHANHQKKSPSDTKT